MLKAEAILIEQEDLTICRNIGKWGAPLIPEGAAILTHCNAGGLATAGYGTALGVIRAAHEAGKKIQVFADETRPWLQGARLTAWELMQEGIPVTLIADNMAGFFMSRARSPAASSAPTASPPTATPPTRSAPTPSPCWPRRTTSPSTWPRRSPHLDLTLATGADIPIEERPAEEVTHIQGFRSPRKGSKSRNPAFDVTPARYIAGIITEKGVVRGDYEKELKALVGQ